MKTAKTASSTKTIRLCTRSMNFAPAMLTTATSSTTTTVRTLLQVVESSKNSAEP